jgi:hypothetical protein
MHFVQQDRQVIMQVFSEKLSIQMILMVRKRAQMVFVL